MLIIILNYMGLCRNNRKKVNNDCIMGAFAHPAYYFQITNMFSCPKMFYSLAIILNSPMKNKIGDDMLNSTKCEIILNCMKGNNPKKQIK